MAILLEIILTGAALLLLVPVTVLLVEILLAVTIVDGERAEAEVQEGERPRLSIVIPAHDEASIIDGTLRSIVPQLRRSDRLIVVADNCSDETAAIAMAAGAEVITRTDLTHRGKGYALDFGIRHLEPNAPDIIVIIDADCRVSAGSIDRLAQLCSRTMRPVQALYLMYAPEGAALNTRIAEFAWTVKNRVRPVGLHRLGLPCQLMGTGMAFPWSCISTARLATGHIVEDLKLGIDLARTGTPPLFCPEALITSEFPTSSEGIRSQRARWEHGHLSVILHDAPHLFLDSLIRLNVNLMTLALDLIVPPLALLTLQVLVIWFAGALLYSLTKAQLPLDIATITAVLLAFSVLLSWERYGRRIISLGSLALGVIYALWKIPLYTRFIVARQLSWVRSKRGGEGRT